MTSPSRFRTLLLVLVSFIALEAGQGDALAQPNQDSDLPAASLLVCATDKFVVYPNEKAGLNAWVNLPWGAVPDYSWTVDGGVLVAKGDEAIWDLSGVAFGPHRATVRIGTVDGRRPECTLTVILSLPPLSLMGEDRETGRSLLPRDRSEDKGYGLYSYLIFGAEPDASSMQRYQNTVLEYLRFPETKLLERNGYKKAELNITYLPMSEELSQEMSNDLRERRYEQYPAIADWILRHYDYARARAFLKVAGIDGRAGPYLLSSLSPLDVNAGASPRLLQDMSTVPPEVVRLWTRRFLGQTAQERFWDEKNLGTLALEVRTFIAVAAKGFPMVVDSLSSLIKLLK